jgi:2-phospho-L-lactate guanylyltransferase
VITLVPDRRRDGTNVIALPVDADVPAHYGAASFSRHLELAMATGYGVQVIGDVRLALDIDNRDDLAHPLARDVLPAWLPTTLANPA